MLAPLCKLWTTLLRPMIPTIVDRLRGRIDVQSEPGDGTTFRICLPANDEAVDEEDA